MWETLVDRFCADHQLPAAARPALEAMIRDALALALGTQPSATDDLTAAATRLGKRWVNADARAVASDATSATVAAEASPGVPAERLALPARYDDLGAIGYGGMGEVRRVRDRMLSCVLAMKIAHAPLTRDPVALSRFIEEAQITAQLQHPGIVPLHELGTLPDGRPYFTMREVHGRTFEAVIQDVHRATRAAVDGRVEWRTGASGWTFRRLIDSLHRVCETVAFAHAHRVVHRDLKPVNIMVGAFGEVLVLDWGIAKVLDGRPDDAALQSYRARHDQLATQAGSIAGTPAYMSIEQARGDRVDSASDVYSLGAILYEVLSGEPPYAGLSVAHVVLTEPRPLQVLAPVDDELVQICQRAVAREAADRYPDAGAMAADLARWLDGSRRREQALAVVRAAQAVVPTMTGLLAEADALEAQASAQLAQLPPFAPVDRKRPAWELQDRAAQARRTARLDELDYLQTLRAALTHAPDLPEAHALLAENHQAHHAAAEAQGDELAMMQSEVQLRAHDDGRWATYLGGHGALSLVTDPPGAEAELYAYESVDRRLVPKLVTTLPRTPIHDYALPMGSYLVRLRAPGHEPVNYPVLIRRLEHWHGCAPGETAPFPVPLPRAGEVHRDEVFVPPGWYACGGDPQARNGLAGQRVWIDGFLVTRFPITIEQYLEFLNDLVARNQPDEVARYLPPTPAWELARSPDERRAQSFRRDEHGRILLQVGQLGWPVTMVNWSCAVAFNEWRARSTGLPYRLLTELEREKAARGVDGRHFPWGNTLDPTFCHMHESHANPGRATKAPVDSYPVDESPYGVRGMAGNVRDWCRDAYQRGGPQIVDGRPVLSDGEGLTGPGAGGVHRMCRGGCWQDASFMCRTAFREGPPGIYSDTTISFRSARSYPAR